LLDQSRHLTLAVLAATTADEDCAAQLALRLGLPLLATGIDPANCASPDTLVLVRGRTLSLQQTGKGAPGPVAVDFGGARVRHRSRFGASELLGKAVGRGKKSPLRVLDATAGVGRDAFVLADLGCEVDLCEREPVIAELLRAGLDCARCEGDSWLAGVVRRMHLYPGDARRVTAAHMQSVDVIYLDPMFPPRGKSAAVKKEMALFQRLLEPATDPQDADTLLLWALQQNTARVVVKRPAKASHLAGQVPSHSVSGKTVRYDVYVQQKIDRERACPDIR
jgi:16S rRNA (guanine1516-N2)-methyltransferase